MREEMIVPTGFIIKDYLENRDVSQKELSKRLDISEKHISNVLNGNSRLTEEFALKLEKLMPDVPATYWLNYEIKYREYLARNIEKSNLEKSDLDEISKRFRFNDYFKDIKLPLVDQAIEMLKLLKINSFSLFDSVYNDKLIYYMKDGGDPESIAIWLNLCESEIDIVNDEIKNEFDLKKFQKDLIVLKDILNNESKDSVMVSVRKLLNKNNIYFVFLDATIGSRIRGALTTYKGNPAIFLSSKFKYASYIYFALLHEIGHLILHYNKSHKKTYVSLVEDEENNNNNNIELEANIYARNYFIEDSVYQKFISQNNITRASIIKFSIENNIIPGILVSMLQYDKLLSYTQFSDLR